MMSVIPSDPERYSNIALYTGFLHGLCQFILSAAMLVFLFKCRKNNPSGENFELLYIPLVKGRFWAIAGPIMVTLSASIRPMFTPVVIIYLLVRDVVPEYSIDKMILNEELTVQLVSGCRYYDIFCSAFFAICVYQVLKLNARKLRG
jgi:hypothetical protein